jgi:chemotaxis protein methyltransferase CheR
MGFDLLHIEDITDRQFNEISHLVKDIAGINLHMGKKELVKARLNKRLRQLQLHSYSEYMKYLKGDSHNEELIYLLDAISTNLTSFFREADHFEYLEKQYLEQRKSNARKHGRLRIWSAGCSTGEEPYSIAMILNEVISNQPGWNIKILATDLSTKVLKIAHEGIFNQDRINNIPPAYRSKYFECVQSTKPLKYAVSSKLRQIVYFSRLNLMDKWPMKGPFDVIFCRNVMIYFDKPTQQNLIERFSNILGEGGILFIGHSESLTGIKHNLKYVLPTIYEKT